METDAIRDEGQSVQARGLALLSYLGILCLVPLILNKRNAFIDFHARQGLILWVWEVLGIFLLRLPAVGKFFFSFTSLATILLSFAGVVAVSLGRAWSFPVVGNWARKI